MFDNTAAKSDLLKLYQAASLVEGKPDRQTEQYIRVGEFNLALDGIAHAYLSKGARMSDSLFQIFERLAIAMQLDGDDEYQGVARLRKAQTNSYN